MTNQPKPLKSLPTCRSPCESASPAWETTKCRPLLRGHKFNPFNCHLPGGWRLPERVTVCRCECAEGSRGELVQEGGAATKCFTLTRTEITEGGWGVGGLSGGASVPRPCYVQGRALRKDAGSLFTADSFYVHSKPTPEHLAIQPPPPQTHPTPPCAEKTRVVFICLKFARVKEVPADPQDWAETCSYCKCRTPKFSQWGI